MTKKTDDDNDDDDHFYQSAELMYTRASRLGSGLPLPNTQMRLRRRASVAINVATGQVRTRAHLCSRKRPTIDLTKMCSDRPGTPGRRQQMPRTTANT